MASSFGAHSSIQPAAGNHDSPGGHLIIEYGDYECPYSRQAFHAIEQAERQLGGNMRFAFRPVIRNRGAP